MRNRKREKEREINSIRINRKQNRSNWIFYIENGPFSGGVLFAMLAFLKRSKRFIGLITKKKKEENMENPISILF